MGITLKELQVPETLDNCGPLACILHGDYWSNNMLFKYDADDEQKPIQIKMVDFQISRIGHPLSDILYFIYTSTLPSVRQQHMTLWLTHYFNTLMSGLNRLDVHPDYHLDDFMTEYKKRSRLWVWVACIVMNMVLDKQTVTALQDLNEGKLAALFIPCPIHYAGLIIL